MQLSEVEPGTVVRVVRVDGGDDAAVALKRLGVCEGRQVEMSQTGDPMVIHVVGCRVGLSRRLAASVEVERCSPAEPAADSLV